MIDLNSKITNINAVAKRVAPKLKKLGVETIEQLLRYYPYRYEDWSEVKDISSLEPGTNVTVRGKIELIQNKRSQWKKRLITEAIVADNTGQVKVIWFHQPYLTRNLHIADEVFLSGKVEFRDHGLQFVHPEYERISKYKNKTMHTARIVPIYSLTKNLTAKQLRYVMNSVIKLADSIPEWLPKEVVKNNNLLPLSLAIRQVHFPDDKSSLHKGIERIKFDELFLIQLRSAVAREQIRKAKAPSIKFKEKETKKFVGSLPFTLTDAQKIAGWEILKDLEKDVPMNRLLEGDVGSGKTVVAGLAIINSHLNKFQSSYMVPTEILAQQHFYNLIKLFANSKMTIALLTGSMKKIFKDGKIEEFKNNKEVYKGLSEGKINLVIGTHALIQNKVEFNNLGLVIVDEQHRFGVGQRKKLKQRNKKSNSLIPHLLSMTATPIPRSLALTVYGDLDLSVINQMPKGRKQIKTEIVIPEKRPEKYKFVADEIKAGRQVFVICPLIDPSDTLGVKAVKNEFEKLDKKIFPDVPIGLMHGKMKPKDKDAAMQNFIDKKTMILVSTPVIEVGIDVPNASVMMIESAERFGLAQLHQFRGRVGRGEAQSYCFLFSETDSTDSLERLRVVEKSKNGFELAEADLKFRGPGEVYGIKQSGYKDQLKVAKLTDYIIIKKTRTAVDSVIKANADLSNFPAIKKRLEKFETEVHFE